MQMGDGTVCASPSRSSAEGDGVQAGETSELDYVLADKQLGLLDIGDVHPHVPKPRNVGTASLAQAESGNPHCHSSGVDQSSIVSASCLVSRRFERGCLGTCPNGAQ